MLRLDEKRARVLVAAVGAVGMTVGVGSIVMPRFGLRSIGLDADGRGVGFLARVFGCRDVVVCASLLRVARQPQPELSWLDALAASQVGDMCLTWWLWRRGEMSRRGLGIVMVSAPPTLVAALAARRALAPARLVPSPG